MPHPPALLAPFFKTYACRAENPAFAYVSFKLKSMKKLTGMIAFTCLLGMGLQAQVKEDVSKAATKVGNKTEQTASKTKAAIVDNKYKDKVGPHGETIYIDHDSKYYYVNKKGRKVYVAKAKLKDKKD